MDFYGFADGSRGLVDHSERLDAFTVLGAALILTGNLLNLKPGSPAPARATT